MATDGNGVERDGATFPLGALLEELWQSTSGTYEELALLINRSEAHVDAVIDRIRSYSGNAPRRQRGATRSTTKGARGGLGPVGFPEDPKTDNFAIPLTARARTARKVVSRKTCARNASQEMALPTAVQQDEKAGPSTPGSHRGRTSGSGQKDRAKENSTKDGGVSASSVKAPTKKWPALTITRKLSANYSFRATKPATPKHGAAHSNLQRGENTSGTRPDSVKPFGKEDFNMQDRHRRSTQVAKTRKEALLEKKADATRTHREQRLARAQAERKRREEERLKNALQRQRHAEKKEPQRRKQRASFHRRKQSERSLHSDGPAAASKKANSKVAPASKKIKGGHPDTPRVATEAAELIDQRGPSLSKKDDSNYRLQQEGGGNSTAHAFPECPPTKPGAPVVNKTNVAISAADPSLRPLDQVPTLPARLGPSTSKTPAAASSTREPPSGGPPQCGEYAVDPHGTAISSELNEKSNQVPFWANATSLRRLVREQAGRSGVGTLIFGDIPDLILEEIFNKKKPYFNTRSSSAKWD